MILGALNDVKETVAVIGDALESGIDSILLP